MNLRYIILRAIPPFAKVECGLMQGVAPWLRSAAVAFLLLGASARVGAQEPIPPPANAEIYEGRLIKVLGLGDPSGSWGCPPP